MPLEIKFNPLAMTQDEVNEALALGWEPMDTRFWEPSPQQAARSAVRKALANAIPGKSYPAGQLLAEAADLGSSDPVTDVTETVLLWAKHLGHPLEYIASEPLVVIRDVYHAGLGALDTQDMSEERP